MLVLLEIRSHSDSGPAEKTHEEVSREVRGKGREGKARPGQAGPDPVLEAFLWTKGDSGEGDLTAPPHTSESKWALSRHTRMTHRLD